MATPSASTRRKKDKKGDKPSQETTDDSCMAKVTQLTHISKDLSGLTNEIRKTVKCDKLESLVTTLKKLLTRIIKQGKMG